MKRLTARPDVFSHRHCPRGPGGAAAALILAFALGACSSSASSAPGSSAPGSAATGGVSPSGSAGHTSDTVQTPTGVTFHGKVEVTGALRLITSFTEKNTSVSNCAEVATKGDAAGGNFAVPSPYVTQSPQIVIRLAHFHGAGTYPPTEMQVDQADSISLKSGRHTDQYVLTSHPAKSVPGQTTGKEVLFLLKNGSGELAFSEAHMLGQKSSPAIAGLISWTCSN